MTMARKPKILVVDDEPRNLRLVDAMLAPLDCEPILANSGEHAIEELTRCSPDLVLLDIMMPGIDGIEVAKRIKADANTQVIPVVMVTALRDVEDRVKALEAGADDFLSKPVDRTELTARVRSLLKVKAYNDHMRNHQQKLEAEVAKRTEQLRSAFTKLKDASLDTINRLSSAAEYKDEDTGSHIVRIGRYAKVIGQAMGLDAEFVEGLLYAAPMHDIGKIGVPDRILLKPGKLDPEEWEIMKGHTQIGAKILAGGDSPFIKMDESIALTHHEKWDGTGDPHGLRGEDIPMEGRIAAIADVFDALTSVRPYKAASPPEEAFVIIRDGRGQHFDPRVVDAFFRIQTDILEIKRRNRDTEASRLIQMNGGQRVPRVDSEREC